MISRRQFFGALALACLGKPKPTHWVQCSGDRSWTPKFPPKGRPYPKGMKPLFINPKGTYDVTEHSDNLSVTYGHLPLS